MSEVTISGSMTVVTAVTTSGCVALVSTSAVSIFDAAVFMDCTEAPDFPMQVFVDDVYEPEVFA